MIASLRTRFSKFFNRIVPRTPTGVLTSVCVLFTALVALGIYRVQAPGEGSAAPRFGVGAGIVAEYSLDDNDPVVRFAATRVGHVIYASRVSDQCQRVLFDNRTGTQYYSQSIDCTRPAAEVVASTERIGALRKTFQK
jgi:hypothetical protein